MVKVQAKKSVLYLGLVLRNQVELHLDRNQEWQREKVTPDFPYKLQYLNHKGQKYLGFAPGDLCATELEDLADSFRTYLTPFFQDSKIPLQFKVFSQKLIG